MDSSIISITEFATSRPNCFISSTSYNLSEVNTWNEVAAILHSNKKDTIEGYQPGGSCEAKVHCKISLENSFHIFWTRNTAGSRRWPLLFSVLLDISYSHIRISDFSRQISLSKRPTKSSLKEKKRKESSSKMDFNDLKYRLCFK